ncbi:MAG: hypothetical protein ACM3U1_03375 [Chloroflexota bacterium]
MSSRYLFPSWCKPIGLALIVSGVTFWFLGQHFDWQIQAPLPAIYYSMIFTDSVSFSVLTKGIEINIFVFLTSFGGILAAFAREKQEDEFIASIRLNSLMWSTLVSFSLLALTSLFQWGLTWVIIPYVFFNLLILLFIIRFNVEIWRLKRERA